MSSDVLSVLELIQLNNYASVVLVTAVVYDYLLTFSREIDYVWCRPWTWISTIFVMVRYSGLSFAILGGLGGSTFVPGPVKLYAITKFGLDGTAFLLANVWEFAILRNAADLIMILRVYAMWNRSKSILRVLLFVYIPQVILAVSFAIMYDVPSTFPSVTIVQIANFSFCNFSTKEIVSRLDIYGKIPPFLLGMMLLVLAVTQTLKQSVAMYKATKQWQPNRYMQLLVRDGILYFLVNIFSHVVSVVQDGPTINSISLLFLTVLAYITVCPIMPRFIIGVRGLFDRDLRGRRQGIDTGFGALSQPAVSQNTWAASAIVFADVVPGQEDIVESDETRLEAVGDTRWV